MKITKARLQQIIKEEVENHLRENENILEFDETKLAEASGGGSVEDLSSSDRKLYDENPDIYDVVKLDGKTKIIRKDIDDPNLDYVRRDRFDEKQATEDQLHRKDSGKEVIQVKTKDKIKVELKSY